MSLSEVPAGVRRAWAGCAALAVVLAACSTLDVGSDQDRTADFSNYRTFSLMQRQHQDVQNPLVISRAEDAIRDELMRKGYTPAPNPASADFAVDFTIGARERTDIRSFPGPYAGPWWGGPGPWWGGPYWGNQVDVRQFKEGTLSIDMFDGHSHRPVWHGWARKELSRRDLQQSEAPVRHAVQAILNKFPSRGPTPG